MRKPHANFLKSNRNNRGGMTQARQQAMKDITRYLYEVAPEFDFAGPRSCEVGHYCVTPKQILQDKAITPLNRQLGL